MPAAPLLRVSVVIPTLNSAPVLERCLATLRAQDYPADRLEVVVADGGSSDDTRGVAARFHVDRVVENPLRTGEAGKAVGARAATGDVLAFVDSDNLLPDRDWLRRMMAPFADPAIVATEPLWYTHRPEDGAITRYCALVGANDPLTLYVGNYDRMSLVTGRWTSLPVQQRDEGDWLRIALDPRALPTIGANGFCVRRDALAAVMRGDYMFDVDVVADLARGGSAVVAKVKVGIVHLYADTLRGFARKQARRIRDYYHFRDAALRTYPWRSGFRRGVLRFLLSTALVVPLLWTSARGWLRVRDAAWWLHAPLCWITLATYGLGFLGRAVGVRGPAPRPAHSYRGARP